MACLDISLAGFIPIRDKDKLIGFSLFRNGNAIEFYALNPKTKEPENLSKTDWYCALDRHVIHRYDCFEKNISHSQRHYEKLSLIGKGGQATVYLVRE
jgi:hypothetical protein